MSAAIAATAPPRTATEQRSGRERRRLHARCGLVAALLVLATPAHGLDFKLWPLIDYHSNAAGERTLHLLGPLFSYETGPQRWELTLRPVFSLTRSRGRAKNELSILYPVFVSRWQPAYSDHRLLGLINYRSETRADGPARRFTIFPLVFYRHDETQGTALFVFPFYADMGNFFGYERVTMFAFPVYLHLQEPLRERTWVLFPFVSWSGGTLGQGYRIWPFYGWDQNGEADRFTYVMWPFYIERERHFTRPERERQLIVAPFYASLDSSTTRSRAYGLLTHTIDREAGSETWGFPWPLCLSRRDLATGQRTALRIVPFYEDSRIGDRHTRFVMWPFYRWYTQEVDAYRYTRSDVLWVLYRNIEQVQLQYHHRERLRTLFPAFRAQASDDHRELSTLALLDALFPHNPTIRRVYAPLWQLYAEERDGDGPRRWSLLWDLVSSDGTQVRYPLYFNFSE